MPKPKRAKKASLVKSVYLGRGDEGDLVEEVLSIDMTDKNSKTISTHIGKIIFQYFETKKLGSFDESGKFVFNKARVLKFKRKVFDKKRGKAFT